MSESNTDDVLGDVGDWDGFEDPIANPYLPWITEATEEDPTPPADRLAAEPDDVAVED